MYPTLLKKLRDGTLVLGVQGLGYVGLPLAVTFSRRLQVLGFDVRPELVQSVRKGDGREHGVMREDLVRALDSRFIPTTDLERLRECDAIIIAVGTPLTDSRDPDLSQITRAADEIAARLRPGQFIVLESTTYPGTTEEVLIPALEKSGLRAGVDFGVAYSPERLDPGNSRHTLEHIPKLVGGTDAESTNFARELYGLVVDEVVPVSHARVAEAAKVIENLFRNVNIALVNEIALIMEHLGIDAWEAIRAASTKPFGFMAFYPGPGVGGHCIPLDPYYLSYRARRAGYMPRFIELARDVNEYMKFHVLHLLDRGLEEAGKKVMGSTIAVLGTAFKKNVSDTRESVAIRIIEELFHQGAHIRTYDPYANVIATRAGQFFSELDIETAVADSDAAILLVDHDEFRSLHYDRLTELMAGKPVWVDTRGILAASPRGSIGLGLGRPAARLPTSGSADAEMPPIGVLPSNQVRQ